MSSPKWASTLDEVSFKQHFPGGEKVSIPVGLGAALGVGSNAQWILNVPRAPPYSSTVCKFGCYQSLVSSFQFPVVRALFLVYSLSVDLLVEHFAHRDESNCKSPRRTLQNSSTSIKNNLGMVHAKQRVNSIKLKERRKTMKITEDKAKELARDHAEQYMPGYSVLRARPNTMSRGFYSIELQNLRGDLRVLRVYSSGNISGPLGSGS